MSATPVPERVLDQLRIATTMLTDAHVDSSKRAKAAYARFNIFTTLLSASDEVRLHTRFIHCLLDPDGLHDCGSLFLDLFFMTLNERGVKNHQDQCVDLDIPRSNEAWKVEREAYRATFGQIDLLIEQTGCGIAIENKINASEQDEQLARYANYLRESYGNMGKLIYLTIDGKKSYTHGQANYCRISYAEHVLDWLEKCIRGTRVIVPVNQALLQYRQVVRELTRKTEDSAIMNSLSDFITQYPDIVRFRKQIDDGIAAARADFLDRLSEGILKELQTDHPARLKSNLLHGRFGADPYGALILAHPPDSPFHNAPFEIWIEHIAKYRGLMIGIESKFEKSDLSFRQKELLAKMNQYLNQQWKFHRYDKADPQALPDGTYWPTGWHTLIYPIYNEKLADLLQTPIPQTVSAVCGGIRRHIKLLEEAYREAIMESGPLGALDNPI